MAEKTNIDDFKKSIEDYGPSARTIDNSSQGGELDQYRFDPSATLGSYTPVPPLSPGSFSKPELPEYVEENLDTLQNIGLKYIKGKPKMGLQFRTRLLERIADQQSVMDKGFQQIEQEIARKTGGKVSSELSSFLAKERSEERDKNLRRIKDELIIARKTDRLDKRRQGVSDLIAYEAAKDQIDNEARDLYMRTNARLKEIAFGTESASLQNASKIRIESQNLIIERDRLLREMLIRKQQIEAQKKRSLGSFLTKLFVGGAALASGGAGLGLFGAGSAAGAAAGSAALTAGQSALYTGLLNTGVSTLGSSLGDLGDAL